MTNTLLGLLAQPNTRSKEDVVRRYDHEVQGGTIVKPFVGPGGNGPADAAVLAPLECLRTGLEKGVALSVGINPAYGAIDPYAMAWASVDEAIRNCLAVGADPDLIALLDNFCWGNPNLPDRLGSLVRCAQGCYEAAVAYQVPFISGKDSLNNEYTGADGEKQAIPGTLLISAIGIVPDISQSVTSDLKQPGNLLYLLGNTDNELGGSTYYQTQNIHSTLVPQPPANSLKLYRTLHKAIKQGLVQACHDCSEGGLAVAAAEMALGGDLGITLHLAQVKRSDTAAQNDIIAFSESLGRLIVEVTPLHAPTFELLFGTLSVSQIGVVRSDDKVQFMGLNAENVISTDLSAINRAWRGHMSTG